MSGNVSRGLLTAAVCLAATAAPVAQAVSDDVALQLLERLGELEKEVSNLRGENETLRNELQEMKSGSNTSSGITGVQSGMADGNSNVAPSTPVITAPQVMTTEAGQLPALEDPVTPAQTLPPPVSVPQSVTIDLSDTNNAVNTGSLPVVDPEERRAVAPVVEFNAGVNNTERVDPQSPQSYYYYGTGDRNQPGGMAPSATQQNNGTAATTTAAGQSAQTLPNFPVPDAHKAKAEYNQAYKALVNDPATAVPAFRTFLTKYPDHELAANAQYWLGEALYAQKDYSGATEEFMVVLKQHKKSSKAPGAALKLGYSFYELRQWDFARRTLEDTVRFFPDSNAAMLAKQRLEKMTAEGH